jgi:hypothetical protein
MLAGGLFPVKRSRLFISLLLIFVAAFSMAQVATQPTLPTGWRKPTPVEATGAWRKKSPARFLVVRGDFDGDGRDDIAELLVSDSGKSFGLFVWLSSLRRWQSIHGADAPLGDLGISLVLPKKFDTLCADDPSVCAPSAPATVDLKSKAIEFFAWGVASSIFYWEPSAQAFRNAPMSD